MFEKGKIYTYNEIKEIFDKNKMDVIFNPFGEDQKEAEENLQGSTMFTTMMLAIPIVSSLSKKLFGDDKKC